MNRKQKRLQQKNNKLYISGNLKQTIKDLNSYTWSGQMVDQMKEASEKKKEEEIKFSSRPVFYWTDPSREVKEQYGRYVSIPYKDDFLIKESKKKQSEMLPDHIHNEIEAALKTFPELFLKRYSNKKVDSLSWNKHDGTIIAVLPPKDGEIPIIEIPLIEYKFTAQLAEKAGNHPEKFTPKFISDNVLEAVMKILLHAKDM